MDRNVYLLEVCRYVDLNPLRARLVRDPGNWPWSSYRAHIDKVPAPVWLDTPAVHGYLLGREVKTPADRRNAATQYVALVAAGKGVKLWDEALSQQIYLGGAQFVERMQALIGADTAKSTDIPRLQRRKVPQAIENYLEHNKGRDHGIVLAATEGQHSLSAIARCAAPRSTPPGSGW